MAKVFDDLNDIEDVQIDELTPQGRFNVSSIMDSLWDELFNFDLEIEPDEMGDVFNDGDLLYEDYLNLFRVMNYNMDDQQEAEQESTL